LKRRGSFKSCRATTSSSAFFGSGVLNKTLKKVSSKTKGGKETTRRNGSTKRHKVSNRRVEREREKHVRGNDVCS